MGTSSGLTETSNRSGLLAEPRSSVLVKVPGSANPDLFRIVDVFLNEGEELFIVVWEYVSWDRVNCQLYSGWRLGKGKPGVIPNGEGLVEEAGESIEVGGIGVRSSVGVGARKRNCTTVVDLRNEALWVEAVRVDEGGGSDVGEGAGYVLCKGVGNVVGSRSEKGS